MNVCLRPTPLHDCALHTCSSKFLYVLLFTVQCAMHNCAGGKFVQCVIKNITVLSQDLDDPYYLCISMCTFRHVQMFAHVQAPAQWKPSWEKSSQGGGIFMYFVVQKCCKMSAIKIYFKVLQEQICHKFTFLKQYGWNILPKTLRQLNSQGYCWTLRWTDLIFRWDVSPVCACPCTSAFPSPFACDCGLQCAYVCIHLHVIVHTHAYICICLHTCAYICMWLCIRMHTFVYVCMPVHTFACDCAYVISDRPTAWPSVSQSDSVWYLWI